MSLLIKALDKAMTDKASTDKAAVQNKQGEKQPLELSLESISPAEPETTPEISLEEEAGLGVPSRYAKPKTATNSKPVKSATLEKAGAAQTSTQPNQTVSSAKPAKLSESTFAETMQASTDTSAAQNTLPPVFQAMASQSSNINQKAAAKVFVANQQPKTASSKVALALLGLAGALVIWLAIQAYGYIKTLMAPEVVVVKPAMQVTPQDVNALNLQSPVVSAEQANNTLPVAIETPPLSPVTAEAQTPMSANPTASQPAKPEQTSVANDTKMIESDALVATVQAAPKSDNQMKRANKTLESSQKPLKNDASLQITSKTQANGVEPDLLAAYAAYNRGDYALAQQKYRLVLQGDVRNTDALLGMAAIAQRQGRDADAVGWYQKVLEIEPRNAIAQAAMVNVQVNTDAVGRESRLKSMIAQQPEAHLYAALGNGYAEQNQWSSAQDAYFNASRLAPNNPDYAFNLAISLEQLGKSNLALAQYERTLGLLNKNGASSPNRAVLEARIQALQ